MKRNKSLAIVTALMLSQLTIAASKTFSITNNITQAVQVEWHSYDRFTSKKLQNIKPTKTSTYTCRDLESITIWSDPDNEKKYFDARLEECENSSIVGHAYDICVQKALDDIYHHFPIFITLQLEKYERLIHSAWLLEKKHGKYYFTPIEPQDQEDSAPLLQ